MEEINESKKIAVDQITRVGPSQGIAYFSKYLNIKICIIYMTIYKPSVDLVKREKEKKYCKKSYELFIAQFYKLSHKLFKI